MVVVPRPEPPPCGTVVAVVPGVVGNGPNDTDVAGVRKLKSPARPTTVPAATSGALFMVG